VSSPLSLFAFETQDALPAFLANWLLERQEDPLEPIWVVVPSAAVRQRLEWDLAKARQGDSQISSNMRYMFPEEFVRTVETIVLESLGSTRHEWNPQNIAARLIGLGEGSLTWSEALREAEFLDEIIRWRRDRLDEIDLPRLARKLLDSDEWRNHGALIQRDTVVENLGAPEAKITNSIVFFGLESAPGGAEFVKLVKAVSTHASVAVLTMYPDRARINQAEGNSGISWWSSLDQHLEIWHSVGVEVEGAGGVFSAGQLGYLQSSIVGKPQDPEKLAESNVHVIGAFGTSRQVEMARDFVIDLLESEKTQPEKILVTSTSLDKFLPHIERHWSYESFGFIEKDSDQVRLPRLAHEITEASSDGVRNRATCAGDLLNLIDNYVSVDQVEDLLQFEVIRENLNLGFDAIFRISELSRQAHVAFGITPSQRSDIGVFPKNSDIATWQRFFDRLAMTAMLPDTDSPDQLGVSSDLEMVAGLSRLTSVIEDAQRSVRLESVRKISEWIDWLKSCFDVVIDRGRSRDDSFERVIESLNRDFEWGGTEILVPFDFFREYWSSLIASRTKARNFGRYGVHVAPISALTSASYDYVVILGLDEENLPNASIVSPTFDPPRVGDPNPRRAVLSSLLLTVMSARKGLAFTYNSRNELTGENRDQSMVLSELKEHLHPETAFIEGARHGFVSLVDASSTPYSFDVRYRGASDLIKQANSSTEGLSTKVLQLEQNAVNSSAPELISVRNLGAFLNNSAKHFVTRGLLGAGMDRASSDEITPRKSLNSLDVYQIREELIERLITFEDLGTLEISASKILDEILARESMAADIPRVLIAEKINLEGVVRIVKRLREDYSCFSEINSDENPSWYRDIHLENGIVINLRSGQPDELNKWTVYRDFSKRQTGDGGGPATRRFHPSKMDKPKQFRATLVMLLDLLIMKINQPESENQMPVATIFFANEGLKNGNPQLSYRYEGTREQAIEDLQGLVNFYQAGTNTPMAIGRYSIPLELHDGTLGDGFVEDVSEPIFNLIFGEDSRDFAALSSAQGVSSFFKSVCSNVTFSRETARERTLGRIGTDDELAKFKPVINTESEDGDK